jgi:hypothetical protein
MARVVGSGRGLLRDVKERQQPRIAFVFDVEIVEAVAAGQGIAAKPRVPLGRPRPQERLTAFPKQIAVVQFVDRVLEIEAPQERIGRDLGGPQDVAATVSLDFAEHQQLADAAIEVAPDPLV